MTKPMLRLRFDDARKYAVINAKEKLDETLAISIRKFQFRDIRPKAASEILDLGDASRLLGHTDKRITETVYRRVGEIVKPLADPKPRQLRKRPQMMRKRQAYRTHPSANGRNDKAP